MQSGAAPPADTGLPDRLIAEGVAVQDGFLSDSRVLELIDCAGQRRARGDFHAARIGGGARRQRREEVRGDHTCWIEEPLFAAERLLLADLEALRVDLNRQGMLGLFDLEVHYAWYPPGAGYARHLDQPQGRGERVVSVIVYLNRLWAPDAGGQLRLYAGDGSHRDIEPLGGRLTCFLSAGLEHSVLPTRAGRLSITGWYRLRP